MDISINDSQDYQKTPRERMNKLANLSWRYLELKSTKTLQYFGNVHLALLPILLSNSVPSYAVHAYYQEDGHIKTQRITRDDRRGKIFQEVHRKTPFFIKLPNDNTTAVSTEIFIELRWLPFTLICQAPKTRMINSVWMQKAESLRRLGEIWQMLNAQVISIESFLQVCFEGKWLQNRLRTDKNESRSLFAVEIQGHQRAGFCIVSHASDENNKMKKTQARNSAYSDLPKRAARWDGVCSKLFLGVTSALASRRSLVISSKPRTHEMWSAVFPSLSFSLRMDETRSSARSTWKNKTIVLQIF